MAIDTSVYERQRRAALDQYSANQVANDYSRTLSQQRGSREVNDYARGFAQQTPKFQAGWGKRGLAGPWAQSGVHQRALQDYAQNYQRGNNQILENYAGENRNFDLAQSRYQSEYDRALADIEAQKQRDIALAALNIQQLKPLIGG